MRSKSNKNDVLALDSDLFGRGEHNVIKDNGVIVPSNRHVIMRIYNELRNLLHRETVPDTEPKVEQAEFAQGNQGN